MKSKTDTKQKKRRGNPMIAQLARTRFRKGVSGNQAADLAGRPMRRIREVAQLAVRVLEVTQMIRVARSSETRGARRDRRKNQRCQ